MSVYLEYYNHCITSGTSMPTYYFLRCMHVGARLTKTILPPVLTIYNSALISCHVIVTSYYTVSPKKRADFETV